MRRFIEPSQSLDKINVTPIIDVALTLVIILLMTAPMMAMSDLEVKLPAARTRQAEEYRNLTITMDPSGSVAIDEKTLPPYALERELRQRLAEPGRENALVVVRADQSLPHAAVLEVLESAKAVGAKRIAIATNPKSDVR
jgi:biopolymer transport protein TolR